MTDETRRRQGVGVLALGGVLFGTTFLLVQGAVDRVAVPSFLAARFLLAGLVMVPLARRRPRSAGEIRDGAIAGACLVVGYLAQTAGLRHTTAATSAFITYLLVVIVPFISMVRTRRAPGREVIAGVGLAVAGLVALSGGPSGFGEGEQLTLVAAVAFAVHIVVLGEVAERHDPVRLTMWQVLTVGLVCLPPGLAAPGGLNFPAGVWAAVVFCGVMATAVAFWCMAWAQRFVPESQAALVLLLEPVSAAVLGELTGTHLGVRRLAGAALMLAGVVVTELMGARSAALPTELAVAHPPDGDSGD